MRMHTILKCNFILSQNELQVPVINFNKKHIKYFYRKCNIYEYRCSFTFYLCKSGSFCLHDVVEYAYKSGSTINKDCTLSLTLYITFITLSPKQVADELYLAKIMSDMCNGKENFCAVSLVHGGLYCFCTQG